MQEKVALITGGARRVGAAIGRLLHQGGMNLMVHYRSSAEEARALQAELAAQRADSVALVQADLLNAGSLPAMVNETLQQFGRLDVLINNASSFFPTVIGEITEREWDDLVGTNLKTPLFLSQAAAPHLRRNHGCIVNIVDIHADRRCATIWCTAWQRAAWWR
jgi:pteridine reductase